MNLGKNTKTTVVSNAVAAGTTAVDPTAVDMQNFESVMFIVQFGTITASAVTSVKAQQSSDNGSSDAFADLEGTGQTVADTDDDLAFIIDIVNPQERYVKPYVSRGTANAVIESITAIQYGSRKMPVTQGATVGGIETHVSPDEGTA
jgi:hypothetical protein